MKRRACVLLLVLVGSVTAGCHHGGTVPPGWETTPFQSAADAPPLSTDHAAQGNGVLETGTLQVFICYGRIFSNHTAVRLEAPGRETLTWDPGGTYKQSDPTRARIHDVLTKNAADVDEWWRYRRDSCMEPVMEVFEWTLDAEQADRLHVILTDWHDPSDPAQRFEPDAGGLQCSTRVSEFLERFADGRPTVTERYFWPHELGEHLWTQQPDRVLVFHSDGENVVCRPAGSAVHE